jgi:hypothetical protein
LRGPSPLAGEGQGGGYARKTSACNFSDAHQHAFKIREHIVVGEALHDVTSRRQPRITDTIVSLLRLEIVRVAIKFNNNPRRMADEIDNVALPRKGGGNRLCAWRLRA